MTYTGIELRSEQVAANRRQARRLPRRELRRPPTWIEGDARQEQPRLAEAGRRFDVVFTCPPYFDLERYSDNPADLSAMEPGGFEAALREVIAGSAALLDEDRFAVWVVGAVRDRATGTLRDLASIVIDAHRKAGLAHYNDAILETARGSLPLRAASIFEPYRKLPPTHQRVLVFVKGAPKRAGAACRGLREVVIDGRQVEVVARTEPDRRLAPAAAERLADDPSMLGEASRW